MHLLFCLIIELLSASFSPGLLAQFCAIVLATHNSSGIVDLAFLAIRKAEDFVEILLRVYETKIISKVGFILFNNNRKARIEVRLVVSSISR